MNANTAVRGSLTLAYNRIVGALSYPIRNWYMSSYLLGSRYAHLVAEEKLGTWGASNHRGREGRDR